MTKEELIKYIEKAFDGVEQPKDITLHVAEAHDAYDYSHNEKHRKSDFFGPWQEVPSGYLKKCQNALSYFDKTGMRYYLPAYMVWYLENLGNTREVKTDNTLYALRVNQDDRASSDYQEERFSLFNEEQMRACALFVKYCAEDANDYTDADFAKRIYEQYWSRFYKENI